MSTSKIFSKNTFQIVSSWKERRKEALKLLFRLQGIRTVEPQISFGLDPLRALPLSTIAFSHLDCHVRRTGTGDATRSKR
jgi:hypothetical protein